MDLLNIAWKEVVVDCNNGALQKTHTAKSQTEGRTPNHKKKWDDLYYQSAWIEHFEELWKEFSPMDCYTVC